MAATADDPDTWVTADLRFYQAICAAQDDELFWPVGRPLEPDVAMGLRVAGMAQHQQQCIPEHRAVREAILARDPVWAHQAVVEPMRTSEADLWQALGSAADAG
jgi:DNA-binding FadR family transcriptional regulator